MRNFKLAAVFFLLLSLVFITGCGRKTKPVYTEKKALSIAEEGIII